MKVELQPGESVTVTLAESDGEFTITFGKTKITVEADMPDPQGREGIIYEETFGEKTEEELEED